MRRLLGWTAGLAGIAALARLLAARRVRPEAPAVTPVLPPPDPAEELRRKLAETRDEGAARVAKPRAPTETIDERRARVHARAQATVEAMEAQQEPPA